MAEPSVAVFLAPGCEEIEALTVVDILFRAGISCDTVSVAEGREVTSSHNVTVVANKHVGEADLAGYDMLGQQVNMTRRFSASSRAVSTFNGVNRYFLLQFFYRFHR